MGSRKPSDSANERARSGRVPVLGDAGALTSNPFAALPIEGAQQPDPEVPVAEPARRSWGRLVFRKERSHRGGKAVVVVGGFAGDLSTDELENLARVARQQLGVGGTVRDREIELQGSDIDKVRRCFEAFERY